MNSKVLSRTDRESTAILTFERPSKLNALNYELVDAIVHALDEIEEEEHIRTVVLTGSGRAFSAGALGQRIARFAPEVVEVCLNAVHRGLNTTIDEGLAIEAEAFGRMVSSSALRQGLDRFITARAKLKA